MPVHENGFPYGFWFLVVAVGLILCNCGGLPDDFENLTVEEKVAAYEKHWTKGGVESEWARMYIAWHGWEAADLMAQYVNGTKRGIPRYEAIVIIRRVQQRGCSLQGTAAESALEDFVQIGEPFSPDHFAAMSALKMIKANSRFKPELVGLKGGPCHEQTNGPQQAPEQ